MKLKVKAMLIVLLMLLPTIPVLAQGTPHDPIVIVGDEGFTPDNGVVGGSGTADDPYIIEGWTIDAGGGTGINVTGTTKYFIIRNCEIYNAVRGIYLDHVGNATIEGNEIWNTNLGVHLYYSTGTYIYNNTIYDNLYGIYLYNSTHSSIYNNTVHDNNSYNIYLEFSSNIDVYDNVVYNSNLMGIRLHNSTETSIYNNTIYDNNRGVSLEYSDRNNITSNTFLHDGMLDYFSYNLHVENNTVNGLPLMYFERASGLTIDQAFGQLILVNCSEIIVKGVLPLSQLNVAVELLSTEDSTLIGLIINQTEFGVYMLDSKDIIVKDSTFFDNEYGIEVIMCEDSTIYNNTIYDNLYGIYVYSSAGMEVFNNTIYENGIGMDLWDLFSADVLIHNNNITSNNYGIELSESAYTKIYDNVICNNSDYGIYFFISYNNQVYRNLFKGNDPTGNPPRDISLSGTQNYIYLNDFYDNASSSAQNIWNSPRPLTYEVEGRQFNSYLGNYWAGYVGTDLDNDYIGDTPANILNGQDEYPLMKGFGNYTILTGIENITYTAETAPLLEYLSITPPTTDLAPYRRYMYVGYHVGIARLYRGSVDMSMSLPRVPQGLAPLRNAVWYYNGNWLYSTAGDAINVGTQINEIASGRRNIWLATDEGIKLYDPRSGTMTDVYPGHGYVVDANRYGIAWFVVDDKLVRYTRNGISKYNLTTIPNSISVGRRGVWLAFGDRLAFFNGIDWTWYNDTNAQDVVEGRRITWFTTPTSYGYIKHGKVYEFQGSLGMKVEMDWSGIVYFMAPEGVNFMSRRGRVTQIELNPHLVVQGAYWPYYVLADWKLYKIEDGNGTAITNGDVNLLYLQGYIWTADGNSLVRVRISDGNVTRIEIPYDEQISGIYASRYGIWFYTSDHVGLYDTKREEFPVTLDIDGIKDACVDRRGNFWFIRDQQVGMVSKDGEMSVKDLSFTPSSMALGRRTDVWMADDVGKIWRLRSMAEAPEHMASFLGVPKDLIVDRRGNPWFAFNGFIVKYDVRRGNTHMYLIDADRLELMRYGNIMAYKDNIIHLINVRARFY